MVDLSFDDILRDSWKLAELTRRANYKPGIVIGLARGGWIPARLVSDALNIRKLLSIGLQYVDTQRTRIDTYQLPEPMPKGQRLLIVEDCVESGSSLWRAREIFLDAGNIVRTASLYDTAATKYVPDIVVRTYQSPPSFPWERYHSPTGRAADAVVA